MPRNYEIPTAFNNAIKLAGNGRRTVSTIDFVNELKTINFEWSLREANVWIEHYQSCFKDISTEEGDRRTFMLYNPNGGG